jgi:hypothetical protein
LVGSAEIAAASDTRDRILLEYWQGHASPWIQTWASIRTRQYQYVEYYGDDEATKIFREYYDLVADLGSSATCSPTEIRATTRT